MLFSEDTLSEIDSLVVETRQRRSELIREACSFYIEEKRRATLREQMKAGYQEMAELNRTLAEELAADFDCVPRDTADEYQIEMISWRKS